MKLYRFRHSADDMGEECIITHIVNEIALGGEYTVCGRAIVDADLKLNGWEPVPHGGYNGTIDDCECKDCKKVVYYFKQLV